MKISEIFYSIQGEGFLTGVPSVFVRTSGCNLSCPWCDTKYAQNGEEMPLSAILRDVKKYDCDHVVITGGEPCLHEGVEELTRALCDYHRTVETNGTIKRNVRAELISLSPKLPDLSPDILRFYMEPHRDYQLKFVVESECDLPKINEAVKELRAPKEKVLLMPRANTVGQLRERREKVIDLCKQYGYRYCDRLHLAVYGNKRGA